MGTGLNTNDVLIDPQGEIYVVYGTPEPFSGLFLQNGETKRGTFKGIIFRHRAYAREYMEKIGKL